MSPLLPGIRSFCVAEMHHLKTSKGERLNLPFLDYRSEAISVIVVVFYLVLVYPSVYVSEMLYSWKCGIEIGRTWDIADTMHPCVRSVHHVVKAWAGRFERRGGETGGDAPAA